MLDLIQAKHEDFEFLYRLKKITLKKYISKTWDWDEKWQEEYFYKNFNPELIKIITKAEKKIGCISIIYKEDQIFLSLIEILPEYQNKGIGSKLIRDLIKRGSQENKTIELQVFKVNQRAFKLYRTLGFQLVNETENHYQMIFQK